MGKLVTGAAGMMALLMMVGCEEVTSPAAAPETGALFAREFSGQRPLGGPAIGLELIAEGLTNPVGLTEPPDGSGRLFITDQAGLIRVVDADGTLLAEPFLDVRDRMVVIGPGFDERGLLGLAFHPAYATNGRFFVYYSAPLRPDGPSGWNHTSHISEFQVSAADPNVADAASERILLQVDQPQFNHNAGQLAFGPIDGFLYIALGDGGGANDVGLGHVQDWYEVNDGGNAQARTNLLGSILRIDVDAGDPYGIPADNPFVGDEGRDEIWAYGLRNPWRMSFDMGGDHQLLAADVGQNLFEEVNVIERRGNYGWNVKEGLSCFNAASNEEPLDDCPDLDPTTGEILRDPVINYGHIRLPGGIGIAVIGGYIYRGSALPQFSGRYIFGDWSTAFAEPDGSVLLAQPRGRGLWHMQELQFPARPGNRFGHYVLGFGQDRDGEIYVLTSDNAEPTGESGRAYRLVGHRGQ
jgi:glucose/arabinose dehydrogenase